MRLPPPSCVQALCERLSIRCRDVSRGLTCPVNAPATTMSVGKVSRAELSRLSRSQRAAAAVFSTHPFNSEAFDTSCPALTRRGRSVAEEPLSLPLLRRRKGGGNNRGWYLLSEQAAATLHRRARTSKHDVPISLAMDRGRATLASTPRSDRIEILVWDWHLLRLTSLLAAGHLFLRSQRSSLLKNQRIEGLQLARGVVEVMKT